MIDQRLELPEKTRGDHRATEAVANGIRIGLGIGDIGERMQHDVSLKGLIIGAVEAKQLVDSAEAAEAR